jgi:hypothetical protein
MSERLKWYSIKIGAIIFIVYIISLGFPDFIFSNFSLISSEAFAKPWMFVTHIFLHDGYLHLIYNLIALLLFGTILERTIGSRNFLLVFFISGIVAGFATIFFYDVAVGASGAIFGVMGTIAVLRPKMVIWVYMIPMYMMVAVCVWAAIDMFGLLYPYPGDRIAHAAHLFGMAYGIAYGLYLRNRYREPKKQGVKYEVVSNEELDEWERRYMMP